MKFNKGAILIFFAEIITLNLWIYSKSDFNVVFSTPLLSLSQIFALFGVVLMAFSLLLSTRIRFVEELFGGLDKVYKVHHIIGSLAFIMIINHVLFLVVSALPSIKAASIYILPGKDIAYDLGIFGLYSMILPFLFILFIKLPYHIWKYTHKILGASFLLGGLHSITIGSDVGNYTFLKIWIVFFIFIGLTSAIYTLFFYKSLGPRFIYAVERIVRTLDVANVYLKPIGRKLHHKPGQFAYFSFVKSKISSESHPFSISSGPGDDLLRFSAKILGDFTMQIRDISEGDLVAVYGSYGKFGEKLFDPSVLKVVWIAGGIGVTPFMSMLKNEVVSPSGKEIWFYYSCAKKEDGVFEDEIGEDRKNLQNFHYEFWCTQNSGYLNIKTIKERVGDIDKCGFLICGPPPMMDGLRNQLLEEGIGESCIITEDFSML